MRLFLVVVGVFGFFVAVAEAGARATDFAGVFAAAFAAGFAVTFAVDFAGAFRDLRASR